MTATILVVEDDTHMADGLAYNLERAGYAVLRAADGPAGLGLAIASAPDLVLLDLMLPDLDGFGLLARLRATGSRVPVIVLSALGDEVHRVRGFDEGADDYVVKPFSLAELLARIRLRLAGAGASTDSFALAGGTVDLARLEFRRASGRTPLTPTEVELLRVLHEQAGRPVTRDDLLRSVWGVDGASSRTLDTHVARLRRKIEPRPASPQHLITVHSVGYRLDP